MTHKKLATMATHKLLEQAKTLQHYIGQCYSDASPGNADRVRAQLKEIQETFEKAITDKGMRANLRDQ